MYIAKNKVEKWLPHIIGLLLFLILPIFVFDRNNDRIVTYEEATGVRSEDTPGEDMEAKNTQTEPQAQPQNLLARLELSWIEPDKTEPAGTRYRTFHSNTINGDASYLIYLPPGHEKNEQQRYPVLYWLHGSNGTQVGSAGAVTRLDRAIRDIKTSRRASPGYR